MKLIVDISKETYNQIINKYHGSNVRPKDYEIAIINGIPLDEIKTEIEEQVLESLSDGGDDWFTSEKIYECLEIINKCKAESEKKYVKYRVGC